MEEAYWRASSLLLEVAVGPQFLVDDSRGESSRKPAKAALRFPTWHCSHFIPPDLTAASLNAADTANVAESLFPKKSSRCLLCKACRWAAWPVPRFSRGIRAPTRSQSLQQTSGHHLLMCHRAALSGPLFWFQIRIVSHTDQKSFVK